MVHVTDRFGLTAGPGLLDTLHRLIHILFAGKSFAILALCFGLSYHFLSEKSRRTGESLVWTGVWRYGLLFIIGMLNSLIFGGDVLQVLAVLGMALVFAANVKDNRWILGVSAVFCLQLPLLASAPVAAIWPDFAAKYLQTNGSAIIGIQNHLQQVYESGTWPQVLWTNLTEGNANKWWYMISSGRLYRSFGLFLLGIYLGRVNFCADPMSHIRKHVRLFIVLAVCLPVIALSKYLLRDSAINPHEITPVVGIIKALSAGYFNMIAVTFTVIALTWVYTRIQRSYIIGLEEVGRMTLTVYIMQSAVFVPILYGCGLGLYKTLNTEVLAVAGLGLFAFQLWFAHLWHKRFSYGPMEWVWRWGINQNPFLKKKAPHEQLGINSGHPPDKMVSSRTTARRH
ncbi:DUF418 domain-containing protein [Asticcacaulis benevestitus]|nr:DUF418 domain-containing protein [Asticcacaulis benevestitus]